VWSLDAEANLQSAKVYLYSLCFTSEDFKFGEDFSSSDTSSNFRLLLLSGLAAAVRLIYTFSEIGTSMTGLSPDRTIEADTSAFYYPKTYLRNICAYIPFLYSLYLGKSNLN